MGSGNSNSEGGIWDWSTKTQNKLGAIKKKTKENNSGCANKLKTG